MKKVSDILAHKGRNIIAVKPDAKVIDALKVMADKNIGSMMVVDNNVYCGLLTERDYARKVVLKGKTSSETLVKEIMTKDLPRVGVATSIDHCMELMSENNLRYLPVFE